MVFQEESALGSGTLPSAPETAPATEWQRMEADADFQKLVGAKRSFIVPATIFFVIYYFALLVLNGWFPSFMDTKVIGQINIAYLFALSEFVMAWIIAAMYVSRAGVWDKLAAALIAKWRGGRR